MERPAADASLIPDAAHAGDGSDIDASATDTDRGVMMAPFGAWARVDAAALEVKHAARDAHASVAAAAAPTARPSTAAAPNNLAHLNAYPPSALMGKFTFAAAAVPW